MLSRLFGMNSGDCGVTCVFLSVIGESNVIFERLIGNPYAEVVPFCRLMYVANLLSEGTPLEGGKNIGSIVCAILSVLFRYSLLLAAAAVAVVVFFCHSLAVATGC